MEKAILSEGRVFEKLGSHPRLVPLVYPLFMDDCKAK